MHVLLCGRRMVRNYFVSNVFPWWPLSEHVCRVGRYLGDSCPVFVYNQQTIFHTTYLHRIRLETKCCFSTVDRFMTTSVSDTTTPQHVKRRFTPASNQTQKNMKESSGWNDGHVFTSRDARKPGRALISPSRYKRYHQYRKDLLMPRVDSDQLWESLYSQSNSEITAGQFGDQLKDLKNVTNIHALLNATLNIKRRAPQDSHMLLRPSGLKFQEAIKMLEQECCARLNSWSLGEIFLTLDVFFCNRYHSPEFMTSLMDWLFVKIDSMKLSPDQIIQFLFYICLHRFLLSRIMTSFEDQISRDIDAYSPQMMAFIAESCYVANCIILHRKLRKKIETSALAIAAGLENYDTLIGCIRSLQHSQVLTNAFCKELGDVIVEHFKRNCIHRHHLHALMQVFGAFAAARFHHEEFCKCFLEYASVGLEFQRYKDVADLVSYCLRLNIEPPSQFIVLLEEYLCGDLMYKETAKRYPTKLASGLESLTMVKAPPERVIKLLLPTLMTSRAIAMQLDERCQCISDMLRVFYAFRGNYLLPRDWRFEYGENGKFLERLKSQVINRPGLLELYLTTVLMLGVDHVKIRSLFTSCPILDMVIHMDDGGAVCIPPDVTDIPVEPDVSSPFLHTGDERKQNLLHSFSSKPEKICVPFRHYKANPGSVKDHQCQLSIKVLNEHNLMANKDKPTKLLLTNIQLLNVSGYDVITISPAAAENLRRVNLIERKKIIQSAILDKVGIKCMQ